MRVYVNILKLQVFLQLLFFSQYTYSQQKENIYPVASLTLDGTTLKESILKIEQETGILFYFREEWLGNQTYALTFDKAPLNEILDALFKDTQINYFINHNKIYLTENTIIKNELPIGYFIDEEPNFSNNEVIALKDYLNQKDNIIKIGKENKSTQKDKYILKGQIKNASTLEPLKSVRIFTKFSSTETFSDINGKFALLIPPGFNTVYAESDGFQPVVVDVLVYGEGVLNIEMSNNVTELDEVFLTSEGKQNIKKVVPGVVSINVKGVKVMPTILGEMDLLKIATTMPGVKTTGEGALGYNVRGGKSDQTLILLDNAVLYNPSHFFGIFSSVNPFSTSSVDIYKGIIPAEYGSRLSSVIDIKTKTINKEQFTGQGNIGPVTANLSLEIPITKNKSAALISFRSTYSDWVLKQLKKEELKNSQVAFYDGILSFESDLNDKNKLKVVTYYSNDRFSISSDSIYHYGNRLLSTEWNHRINDKHDFDLQLSNSKYTFGLLYDSDYNSDFDLNYFVNDTELKLKFNYLFNNKHKIYYGLSSKLYKISPGEIKPLNDTSIIGHEKLEHEKGIENALFIADKYDFNEKLSLDLGLRFSFYSALGPSIQNIYEEGVPKSESSIIKTINYNNNAFIKTYFNPEYRASFRYAFNSNMSIKGGYNKSVQYIHMLSNTTSASPIDIWKLSDLNIKPQISHQVSLGFFRNLKKDKYELSFETYFKKMRNTIDFRVGADLFLNENIEYETLTGDGKAYGIEFMLKKNGRLNGWIGYTYSKALLKFQSKYVIDQINEGKYFPANFDKPHDVSLVSNYKVTERYSFSANFVYQTGRPITFPVGRYWYNGTEHVLYSERNQFRIPDYYRLDLGINIEGNHKIKKLAHSFWNISVYNILGRNNPYSIFFVNEEGVINAYQASIFAVPIPTISYNFKF